MKHYDMAEDVVEHLYDREVTTYAYVSAHASGEIGESSKCAVFSYGDELPVLLTKGRNFTQEDFEEQRRVALVSENMIGNLQQKGKNYYISIENEEYQVVGIYEPADYGSDLYFAYFPEKEEYYKKFLQKSCRGFISMGTVYIICRYEKWRYLPECFKHCRRFKHDRGCNIYSAYERFIRYIRG